MVVRSAGQAGFSLLEVVVVVAIAGIVTVLILPDFNRLMGRYALESAAREMAAHIRALQESAMKDESVGYRMLFDEVADSYSMNIEGGASLYRVIRLPASVDLAYTNFNQHGQIGLLFAANGNPRYRFGGHITLQDRVGGTHRYIVIDSIGRVRIGKEPP